MRLVKASLKKIIYKADILYRLYEAYSFARYRKSFEQVAHQEELKLHLGCGPNLLEGWINIDTYLSSEILTARLPKGLKRFASLSVRYIYASHVWEHLEYHEAQECAKECYRILVPGGALRIVVPGIEKIIRAYAHDDKAFFDIQATMHPPWCTTKLEHLMYALQQDGEHKYGYDFQTLKKLLSPAGFTKIIESDYNKSHLEDLRIDYRDRQGPEGEYLSLYVDAIK